MSAFLFRSQCVKSSAGLSPIIQRKTFSKISPSQLTCCPLRKLIPHQHGDVIKWKHFPRYWPFVWGIHRSLVNSPHKGQWRGALMFSLICAWIYGWVNNRKAGDLRRHCAQYDVTVMVYYFRNGRYSSVPRCPMWLQFINWLKKI